MKSSSAKRVMRQNKKSGFRCFSQAMTLNVLAQCYVKIFFRTTSYKAVFGCFVISDLLQNGMLNVGLLSFANMDITRFMPELFKCSRFG